MKNAIQIVLTFSLAFGVVGCDQYWQQLTPASGLPGNMDKATVGRPLPVPPAPKVPGPASLAPTAERPNAGSAGRCTDGEHEIGERWKDDCNECWCQNDGSIVCTRMFCK